MKKIKVMSIVVVFNIMIGVCGCSMVNVELTGDTKSTSNVKSSASTKSNVILNERQKSILAEEGLSTDYNELTWTQKEAIVAIE